MQIVQQRSHGETSPRIPPSSTTAPITLDTYGLLQRFRTWNMQTANANDPRQRLILTISEVRLYRLPSPNLSDVLYFTCIEKRRTERTCKEIVGISRIGTWTQQDTGV